MTTLTYIGGPTALLTIGALRLLTDPTFDPPGTEHPAATGAYVLSKTTGPAIPAAAIGDVDAVLLSHDHHADNLDRAGRVVLSSARTVLTTMDGAVRLAGRAIGLAPWAVHRLRDAAGTEVRITATPARHGPAGGDRGPVIGFVVEVLGERPLTIYVTGDTTWFDGVAEVAARFAVDVVVAFAGAARVAAAGPAPLTLTADEAVTVARHFKQARLVPLHFEGWQHFSEGRDALEVAFRAAGLEARLRWPVPGQPLQL